MAFLKVALALCASLYVTSAQFTPGPVPACSPSTFMPHQTYCDMYYRCISTSSGPIPQKCGAGTQWDNRITACNTASLPNTGVCVNWQCNGNRYPDVCCNKYWTCTANNAWVVSECQAGTTFDMASGQCLPQGQTACNEDSRFCTRSLVSNNNWACSLVTDPSNQCGYIQAAVVRQCPEGSKFNQTTCGCTDLLAPGDTTTCRTSFDFSKNKALDAQCRASFRTLFDSSLTLTAFSDKLGQAISVLDQNPVLNYGGGYFLGSAGAVSVSGNEAQLLSNGYIYAYYFENNEIMVPTAFQVEFRPTNFLTGSTFDLLSNTFSIPNGVSCSNSLTVSVRNDGFANLGNQQNEYRYTISVSMTGMNQNVETVASINDLSIVVPQSSVSNLGESGSPLNYLRFTLAIGTATTTAEIVEMNSNFNNGFSVNRVSRTAAFGVDHLSNSKCGLTVGSSMTGSVREFNVYEGCDNGFVSLLNTI